MENGIEPVELEQVTYWIGIQSRFGWVNPFGWKNGDRSFVEDIFSKKRLNDPFSKWRLKNGYDKDTVFYIVTERVKTTFSLE